MTNQDLTKGLSVFCHTAIKIDKGVVIYFDPFKIQGNSNDADVVFITHEHYDHFSPEDVKKVMNENTDFVVPQTIADKVIKELNIPRTKVLAVVPKEEYSVNNVKFQTVPAYNVGKDFHPKANAWVGYIVEIGGNKYYVAGDTDVNEDILKVKCDVAFVPVSGTYTMDSKEASELINTIKPKVAIPTHYGCIVGEKADAENFKKCLASNVECLFLI